jgi:hypothetical protein
MMIVGNYLVKAKIFIGQFLGGKAEDAFIELKEPDVATAMKFNKSGQGEETISVLIEKLPELLVNHDLKKSENESLSPIEVAKVVTSKIDLFTYVMKEYKEKVLFTQGRKESESSDK